MGLEDDIRVEETAEREFRRLIRKAAKVAVPIARWGDGNGGAVLSIVMQELKAAGIYRDPQKAPGYRKKRIGNQLRTEVYERDGYACVKCGSRRQLSVDHIVPEIHGGPTEIGNLQTMCRPCNSKKGARKA